MIPNEVNDLVAISASLNHGEQINRHTRLTTGFTDESKNVEMARTLFILDNAYTRIVLNTTTMMSSSGSEVGVHETYY